MKKLGRMIKRYRLAARVDYPYYAIPWVRGKGLIKAVLETTGLYGASVDFDPEKTYDSAIDFFGGVYLRPHYLMNGAVVIITSVGEEYTFETKTHRAPNTFWEQIIIEPVTIRGSKQLLAYSNGFCQLLEGPPEPLL